MRSTLAVAMSIWASALACDGSSPPDRSAGSSPSPQPAERRALEGAARMSIPASAQDLRWHVERGLDVGAWLRFRIPCNERDALVSNVGFNEPLSNDTRYVHDHSGPETIRSWWQPDGVASFMSGSFRQEAKRPRYAVNVLLDAAPSQTCVVYVFTVSL
jgi:hypothetical protein